MSNSRLKINSRAAINALSMKQNIRSMLRRNLSLMNRRLGEKQTEQERKQLKSDTEGMAEGFVFMLSTIFCYMTDEEICDYLDGWKHIIIDCHDKPIIHFD